MRRVDPWVGIALEYGRQVVSMLFAIRTPSGRRLLEHAIVAQPGYMRTSVRKTDGRERTVIAEAVQSIVSMVRFDG